MSPSGKLPAGTLSGSSNRLIDAWTSLDKAEGLRKTRQYSEAKSICERLLRLYPDYVGALHTLGLVLSEMGEDAAATSHLVTAAALNPRDWKILTALSGCYIRTGAHEMAARVLEQAQRLKPGDLAILIPLGEIYRQEREYDLSAKTFKEAFALDSSMQSALFGHVICCMQMGDEDAALESLRILLEMGARDISTLSLLGHIRREKSGIDVMSLLDSATPRAGQSSDEFKSSLAMARGAALHASGRFDEAWRQFVAGNRLIFPLHAQANANDERQRTHLIEILRKSKIRPPHDASPSSVPVSLFILGPSRSGKTTLERLTASLAGAQRGYENPSMERAVRRTFQNAGLPTRERIIELPPSLDTMFRGFYEQEIVDRAGPARLFTNTHPGRIDDVARLAGAVPSARFIFVRRNLDDLVLRIYMQKYLASNHYAYSLATIRQYISWYNEMSDVILERLPETARLINYEDMIASPRSSLAIVAELCGLEMPDGPLPPLGDDRDCAAPYRDLMESELRAVGVGPNVT